jgi:hypothetical protein
MRRLLKWMLYAFAGFVVIIAVAVALAPAPDTNPSAQQSAAKQRAPEGSLGSGTKEDPPPIEDDTGPTEPRPEQKQPSKIEPRQEEQALQDYIKLTGTAKGASCSVMDDKNQRSVDSPVPGEIPIQAGFMSYVGATCQKVGAQGTLTVEIYQGGDRVKRGSTSAQYGVISIDNS